jgi:hypothetical protein
MSNIERSENRVVKVVSTASTKIEILNLPETATWGDVKKNLPGGFLPQNPRVVVRETKQDLVDDKALLPNGEISIWLSAGLVKSGNGGQVPLVRPLVESFTDEVTNAFDVFGETLIEAILNDPSIYRNESEDEEGYGFYILQNEDDKVVKPLKDLGMLMMTIGYRVARLSVTITTGSIIDPDNIGDAEPDPTIFTTVEEVLSGSDNVDLVDEMNIVMGTNQKAPANIDPDIAEAMAYFRSHG